MPSDFRHIAAVSLSTVGSRILGLFREVLMFAMLGAGLWSSAFVLAFTLPNLFRRLLGEGALSAATVPVFTEVLAREGRPQAFFFLNRVLIRVLLILLAVVAVGCVVLLVLRANAAPGSRWGISSGLAALLMPYMVFVCLAAVVGAVLNVLGRFLVPASGPILLNACVIGAMFAVFALRIEDPLTQVLWLCAGVLVGGALQLGLPVLDLRGQGWGPLAPAGSSVRGPMHELWRLFVPGVAGAAILQVNILVSRLLAFILNDFAASVLYLGSRLMELPLGIFTVAVATVYFPKLSRVAFDENGEFAAHFLRAIRLVAAISVPAGVGLVVLARPIVDLLFAWGAFDAVAVERTVPVVAVYGLGLLAYSVATLSTRGLHAIKDMKSPVRIAAICLGVNLALCLSLMFWLGTVGLALANVLSASLQAILLWRSLSGQRSGLQCRPLLRSLARIGAASVLMGGVCWTVNATFLHYGLVSKGALLVEVALLVPVAALVYFLCLGLFRFEELEPLRDLVKKPFRRIRS